MAAPKAGGFKLSLAGAKNKSGTKGPLGKLVERPRLNLGDDEPDEVNKEQEIVGWDAAGGGAVELNGKKEEDKGPRIIPALPNRRFGEVTRKRKLPHDGGHPEQNGDVPEKMDAPKVTYGLTIFKKDEAESGSPEPMDTAEDSKPVDDGLTEEQRLEKNALDALIHGKSTEQIIIPLQSEEEAFRNDIRDAPDAPTLEAYEATPIEGFGAALLRGMGWKDDDKKPAAKPKEVTRRPALLGIGAKPEAAVGIELGAWGKGTKKTPAVSYNPVTLKNKRTGEMISEEELKARLEAQKLVPEEKPSRSSKYDDEDDERRREKRKERKERDRRDDDYDSERRKDKDRRREKDDENPDRERRREKRYREDDYDDSDRRREKRREKDRRDGSRSRDDYDRRDKGRERDRRHRSRSPDNDAKKEKRRERERRDRDRSRSRDSEDRRKRRRDYDEDGREERKRRHRDDKYYDR
jgi:hypothetical protein